MSDQATAERRELETDEWWECTINGYAISVPLEEALDTLIDIDNRHEFDEFYCLNRTPLPVDAEYPDGAKRLCGYRWRPEPPEDGVPVRNHRCPACGSKDVGCDQAYIDEVAAFLIKTISAGRWAATWEGTGPKQEPRCSRSAARTFYNHVTDWARAKKNERSQQPESLTGSILTPEDGLAQSNGSG